MTAVSVTIVIVTPVLSTIVTVRTVTTTRIGDRGEGDRGEGDRGEGDRGDGPSPAATLTQRCPESEVDEECDKAKRKFKGTWMHNTILKTVNETTRRRKGGKGPRKDKGKNTEMDAEVYRVLDVWRDGEYGHLEAEIEWWDTAEDDDGAIPGTYMRRTDVQLYSADLMSLYPCRVVKDPWTDELYEYVGLDNYLINERLDAQHHVTGNHQTQKEADTQVERFKRKR